MLSVLGINILGYERAVNGLLKKLAKLARRLKFKSWHATGMQLYCLVNVERNNLKETPDQ